MAQRINDAKNLAEATTFKAKTVGFNHTWDNEDTVHELADNEDVTIQIYRTTEDGVPTFVVEQNDETTTFGPENNRNQNYQIVNPGENNDLWLWTWAGSPIDHANRFYRSSITGQLKVLSRKHHIPVGMYREGDPADQRRFAVIGLETSPNDIPSHDIQARFRGGVRLELYLKDGTGIVNNDRLRFNSDITLTANFSESTIQGVMDNWENQDNRSQDLSAYSYMLKKADIAGNGFTTTMLPSQNCMNCPEVLDSTINGKFYGPFADETGGTIQGEFRNDGSEYVGIGIFYTSQD